MPFLAIDLGTTYIKGAILDLEEKQIQHIRRVPFPRPISGLPSLFHEVDPKNILAAVKVLIHELLEHAPNCAGLVMCSQMHGLVLTNERGKALSNHISWLDQRVLMPHPSGNGSYFERLQSTLPTDAQQQLGNELQPSRPLCYLYWLAEQGQLSTENAIPASLADFVLANLCETTPVIEMTNAGAHAAFDMNAQTWHTEAISSLGLSDLQWPTIYPFGKVVGEFKVNTHSLPCYTPVGDHQCALVGAFLDTHELSLNISTGSQASMVTSELVLGDYQTRPYFDGRFLNTFTGIPAGRSLNHLVTLLCELTLAQNVEVEDPWTYIAQRVEEVYRTDLDVDLSFFDSMSGSRGHISNISEENLNVGHLFHAAFQNMAHNYLACAQRLSPQQEWTRLVFSGGLAQRLAILRQIILEHFQIDHRVCVSQEDTLLGLMALAMVVSGQANSVQEGIQALKDGKVKA